MHISQWCAPWSDITRERGAETDSVSISWSTPGSHKLNMHRLHRRASQRTRRCRGHPKDLHPQEVHSYPAARRGVPFLVDVRLTPEAVVIEADAPTLTKDDIKACTRFSLSSWPERIHGVPSAVECEISHAVASWRPACHTP